MYKCINVKSTRWIFSLKMGCPSGVYEWIHQIPRRKLLLFPIWIFLSALCPFFGPLGQNEKSHQPEGGMQQMSHKMDLYRTSGFEFIGRFWTQHWQQQQQHQRKVEANNCQLPFNDIFLLLSEFMH